MTSHTFKSEMCRNLKYVIVRGKAKMELGRGVTKISRICEGAIGFSNI